VDIIIIIYEGFEEKWVKLNSYEQRLVKSKKYSQKNMQKLPLLFTVNTLRSDGTQAVRNINDSITEEPIGPLQKKDYISYKTGRISLNSQIAVTIGYVGLVLCPGLQDIGTTLNF